MRIPNATSLTSQSFKTISTCRLTHITIWNCKIPRISNFTVHCPKCSLLHEDVQKWQEEVNQPDEQSHYCSLFLDKASKFMAMRGGHFACINVGKPSFKLLHGGFQSFHLVLFRAGAKVLVFEEYVSFKVIEKNSPDHCKPNKNPSFSSNQIKRRNVASMLRKATEDLD